MGTLTSSAFLEPAKGVEKGVVAKYFEYQFSGASSAGDAVLLARIPNKARIVDCRVIATSAATGTNLNVSLLRGEGTNSVTTTLAVLGSFTAVAAAGRFSLDVQGLQAGAHTKVSLSGSARAQFAVLSVHVTGGSQTASISFNGVVMYSMDTV